MLCYAVLWFVMLTYFMSKIICSQWVKSCDPFCFHFWEVMFEIFVSKTLCTVMNSYLMSKILLDLMKLTVDINIVKRSHLYNFNFSESPSVKYWFCEKYMIVEDILLPRKKFNAICGLLSKSQQYMYDF